MSTWLSVTYNRWKGAFQLFALGLVSAVSEGFEASNPGTVTGTVPGTEPGTEGFDSEGFCGFAVL